MTDPLVHTTLDGACGVLEINRHHARNALNIEACRGLREGLAQLVGQSARAVVVTGAGTAFCAGADLDVGPESGELYPEIVSTLASVQNAPVPVVAAVNGPAVGAGTLLAMACDFRVVADAAWFKIPAVDLALALDGVTVRHLERLVGGARARAMLLASARLSAAEAVDCGFAYRFGTLADARRLAGELAGKAPLTMAHLKAEFTHDGWDPCPADERDRLAARASSSADTAEARAARAEKRTPDFQGR